MTREELANISASRVRKEKPLFNLFKKYAVEDAHLLYKGGKLPSGCFGCQFSTLFQLWRGLILENNTKLNTMSTRKQKLTAAVATAITYVLLDPAHKVYFKGALLSKNSSDEEWKEWINHPIEEKDRENRKKIFKVLPEDSVEKKEAKKGSKTPAKKSEERSETKKDPKTPEVQKEEPSKEESGENSSEEKEDLN